MPVTLLTGGVRSGKSRWAEHLLRPHRDVTYLATASGPTPDDPEWLRRVEAHRARRPAGWHTIETLDVTGVVSRPGGPVLVECLGTWLTGVVDDAAAWEDLSRAETIVAAQVDALTTALRDTTREVVVVGNEVGWSLVPLTASGRFFQDQLGRLTAAVAQLSDRVFLVVAGRLVDITEAPRLPADEPPPHPGAT